MNQIRIYAAGDEHTTSILFP